MSQPLVMMYPYSNILLDSHLSGLPAIEEFFGNGQHAFERSQFPKALDNFSRASMAIDCHLRARVLLGRAMCREMQGNMPLAFADAKKVVRLSPTWSGGYMYLSRLYSRQCDYAQVLLTLQAGVAKSNNDDPRYEELVYQRASMDAQIKRRNSSLIDRLPVENLINVFSHLDFESRIQSASACRYWRRFLLERFPFMWITIDLQKSHKVLKNIMPWHNVRMVRISCSYAEKALQILVKKNICGIQILELRGCSFKAETLFKVLSLNHLSLQTLVLVATTIPSNVLLGTVFDTMPNLLHFTSTEQAIKTPSWPEEPIHYFDSISHHDQHHYSHYKSQRATNCQQEVVSQQAIDNYSQRSTIIRDLALMQLNVGPDAALNLISRILCRSPNLQALTLHEVDYEVLSRCKGLQHLSKLHLDLAASTAATSGEMHYRNIKERLRTFIAKVVTQLQDLVLTGAFIDNQMLSIIANNGFQLQRIKLSYNHLLPDGILHFALNLRESQRFSPEPLRTIELTNMHEFAQSSTTKLRDELKRVCHIKLVIDSLEDA